ncbi:hypothetical protein BAUCODRAFT_71605 [Baudoinia panamericana UAMH 10762]|uniref:Tryptophan synthase beta chain-like PALP domain-containing protein n=1 Tax=Baudoinia panamericana (strain UAMH 10762) TaxID=717646 RepID=M2LMY2_BAUPA|nr:uncharacterized protein BAUCODRAFT_71605 [Baudoinia panamericana UAMH 10762]EMC95697.1 hypothetical protein BAUCODRAFT_71605 [Baudoinia panamericana UAMH 10762]
MASTHTVTHLDSSESFERPAIEFNKHYRPEGGRHSTSVDTAIDAFHRQLPEYGETRLHSLPEIAKDLGFAHVVLKEESTRFGLPSFKIAGASWAIHQALCEHLRLPPSTSFVELKEAIAAATGPTVRLVTCTEGNWGRAVARMAKYYRLPATIYVPYFMNTYVQGLIRGEDAEVRVLENGSYDDTIEAVRRDAEKTGALMVMDFSWAGYEKIPRWVTEGYSTILRETDRQVTSMTGNYSLPKLAFVSVGVGSWAHAVVEHYQADELANEVVSVEPDTAACLKESLLCGALTSICTGESIMNGMNCGTPSALAWPVLRDGIYAAVAVTDKESHTCVQELQKRRINAGPCGAATLAALRKLCADTKVADRQDKIAVLFSSEGMREYDPPV